MRSQLWHELKVDTSNLCHSEQDTGGCLDDGRRLTKPQTRCYYLYRQNVDDLPDSTNSNLFCAEIVQHGYPNLESD